MNQRILLPAIVIGTLFALLLTFIESRLPTDGPLAQFLVNAAVICAALLVYGVLMQKAAGASLTDGAAPDATAARKTGSDNAPRPQRAERSASADRASADRASADRAPAPRRAAKPRAPEPAAAPAGPREEGHIKWFSGTKGYGFIIRADGSEIFVHHRAIRGQSRGDLPDGQPVSFVVIERDKGPQADEVDLIGGATA